MAKAKEKKETSSVTVDKLVSKKSKKNSGVIASDTLEKMINESEERQKNNHNNFFEKHIFTPVDKKSVKITNEVLGNLDVMIRVGNDYVQFDSIDLNMITTLIADSIKNKFSEELKKLDLHTNDVVNYECRIGNLGNIVFTFGTINSCPHLQQKMVVPLSMTTDMFNLYGKKVVPEVMNRKLDTGECKSSQSNSSCKNCSGYGTCHKQH